MANYFTSFPTVQYDTTGKAPNQYQTVKNIMTRQKLKASIVEDITAYYPYFVQEGERVDTVSYNYYGTTDYAYLILLINNIIDPLFDWPLSSRDFDNYMNNKYGNIEAAQGETKYYYQIVRAEVPQTNYSDRVDEVKLIVDQTTYDSLDSNVRKTVSSYDYEVELNDLKRYVKVIDRDIITNVDYQFKREMR